MTYRRAAAGRGMTNHLVLRWMHGVKVIWAKIWNFGVEGVRYSIDTHLGLGGFPIAGFTWMAKQ